MKEKYYYSVGVYSSVFDTHLTIRVQGVHIIKAYSKENALEIRERYGISNPFHAKGKLHITCRKLNMHIKYVQDLIKRRQKGFEGSVWYEDKNNKLCKETNNK